MEHKYSYLDNVMEFFFIKIYRYLYQHFFRITKVLILWPFFFVRDPLVSDFLSLKLFSTIIFPYKLYFFKKKKKFYIRLLFNNNYVKKNNNIYFFYVIFKLLNLRKKIFFLFIY